jgi:CRP/FNR family transcriptional regulator, cyclic AMP receptor protein
MPGEENNSSKWFDIFSSRDLKTPLGTVANLCDEVIDEFGTQIPHGAKALIASAREAAFSLSRRIDELRALSTSHDEGRGMQTDAVPSVKSIEGAPPEIHLTDAHRYTGTSTPGAQWRAGKVTAQDATIHEMLRVSLLREPIPDDVVAKLVPVAVAEHRVADSILFREGEPCDSLFLVVSGLVAIEMYVPRRGPVRLLTVGPGEILGWSAVLGSQRMTATAIVLDETDLIRIPAGPFSELCVTDPEVGYALMRRLAVGLSRRLFATRLQLLDLFAETPPVVPGNAPQGAPAANGTI